MSAPLPVGLDEATHGQPAARAALAAALSAGPAHAYLFTGPGGLAAAARAFAAELLAEGSQDPASARERALADPSPHPDLVWLTPPGGQHLVDDVREQVIRNVSLRPFEGERRVFVIATAEALAEESQNALLKTLEEPPPYAHLLLLSARPGVLLPTVVSRCQRIRFQAVSAAQIENDLAESRTIPAGEAHEPHSASLAAAARLAGGDPARARFLAGEPGQELRAAAESIAAAVASGETASAPWKTLLEIAEKEGAAAASEAKQSALERAELAGDERIKARARRDGEAAARRAARRRRTEALDLGLALCAAWFRDLAAHAAGAGELALNTDRAAQLAAGAEGVDPVTARRAAELALEARRRLRVNVSEELCLEWLAYSAEAELTGASAS